MEARICLILSNFVTYRYDGGDAVKFNAEWNQKRSISVKASNPELSPQNAVDFYLAAVSSKEREWCNGRCLWLTAIPVAERLPKLQGGLTSNFSSRIGKDKKEKEKDKSKEKDKRQLVVPLCEPFCGGRPVRTGLL